MPRRMMIRGGIGLYYSTSAKSTQFHPTHITCNLRSYCVILYAPM